MKKRIAVLRFGWLPVASPPIRHMMNALLDEGHHVCYVKSKARSRDMATQPHLGAENRIFSIWLRAIPSVMGLRSLLKPLILMEFALRCAVAGFRCRPDLVVAVDLDTLAPAWLIAKLRGARLLYYALELYTDRPYVSLRWMWNRLERLLIGTADLVIACEPNRGRILQERYRLETRPLTILNVAPRREIPKRSTRIAEYLGERGIEFNHAAIYHGWIKPSRGSESLAEAAAHLDPGVVLFLIGPIETGYRTRLQERIGESGVDDRIVIHPMVPPEELDGFIRSADLSVVLLLNDCLNNYYCAPSKLYESLAYGLPVVTSDFPGLKDVVEGQDVGLCVDPEDPMAIAQAINRVMSDDVLRTRMGENARRAAQETYCYEIEGPKLTAAFDQLLAGR